MKPFRLFRHPLTAILLLTGAGLVQGANTAEPQAAIYGDDLGTVQFQVSCDATARDHAQRGLALLHHMTYEGARAAFEAAGRADQDCAMAAWGQAMSYIHPIWSDPPSEADFAKGRELVREARQRQPQSDWERAFIDAVAAYYEAGRQASERPNLEAFEAGWESAHQAFPDNPEATVFYALAHLGTADPADKSYEQQIRSARLAQGVLEKVPDHPGAHHYILHAYDYPPLAERALEVARSYGRIAPAVPHALHMPSHIFTRLGLWEESVAMNRRSAAAALEHPVDGEISLHYPHALDYLAYAYLQRANDQRAEAVELDLSGLDQPMQRQVASAYAAAAIPARLALERQQWEEAAALQPRVPEAFPWDDFPAMEAITHFARALGAARSDEPAVARESLARLATLRDQAAKSSEYWADQVEIQRLAGQAWLELAQGKQDEALATMRQAAAMEVATEKHPVMPAEVLPARELLADMFMELGRYREAENQYAVMLEASPGRFNSLYGAGRAAELQGNMEQARRYYGELAEMTGDSADRPRLQQAEAALSERGQRG